MENIRLKIVPIRLSDKELVTIQEHAKSEGLGVSPYIRRLVLLDIKNNINKNEY